MTTEEKKRSKELLSKLHEKYYGKKKTKESKTAKAPKEAKEPSRHQLMLHAKAKGIKNFRVINKVGLVEVLKEGTTQERINEIIAESVKKWKAGWGKGK